MTPKEAFKIGFMHKCATDGLTSDQTLERIRHAKAAAVIAAVADGDMTKEGEGFGIIGELLGGGKDLMSWGWNTAWPLALTAPPIAGALSGKVLADAQDDTYDEDEARKRELIAAYAQAKEQLERSARKRNG